MAHTRQSRPGSGLGFQMQGLSTYEVVPSGNVPAVDLVSEKVVLDAPERHLCCTGYEFTCGVQAMSPRTTCAVQVMSSCIGQLTLRPRAACVSSCGSRIKDIGFMALDVKLRVGGVRFSGGRRV